MTKVLALALISVTLLPILIFATDFTNGRVMRSLRERALARSGATVSAESQSLRQERRRIARANVHPTASTAATSMVVHFGVLILIAAVGRRLFALRL